jgi:hypothetical protein
MKVKDMIATVMYVGGLHKYINPKGEEQRMCMVSLIHEGNTKSAIRAFAWGGFTTVEPGDTVRVTLTKNEYGYDGEYLVTGIMDRARYRS